MKDTEKKLAKEIAKVIIDYLDKKGAANALPTVIEILQKRGRENSVYVYTPRELKKNERLNLEIMFKKLTDTDVVNFSFIKDESLLDGVKIMYKDKIWDFSLAGQLRKLKLNYNA